MNVLLNLIPINCLSISGLSCHNLFIMSYEIIDKHDQNLQINKNLKKVSIANDQTQTFHLSHHGISILEKLLKQYEELQYCDVIFKVQDATFQAHRCVLAACSSYLASLFRSKSNNIIY